MTSSSITLKQTLEWAKRFIFQRPTANGSYLEPALTSANLILQTILGAPFAWRWNRRVIGFMSAVGQQDYTVFNWAADTYVLSGTVLVDTNGYTQMASSTGVTGDTVPVWSTTLGVITQDGATAWTNGGFIGLNHTTVYNFGWIETASVQTTNPNTFQPEWKEIEPKICLGLDSARSRPHSISAQVDDGNGNITFRLMPVPDKAYPVSITLQQKPTLMKGLGSFWAPIPDEYSHIYNWGLLSLLFLFADDPRFQMANSKFVAHLLSASQGLTETEKNIFLSQWQAITGTQQVLPATIQQGFAGRQAL
jgi:hypothetical protein